MKNNLTSYFIGLLLILFCNTALAATGGTVKFSGAIIDTPCSLTLASESSSSSSSLAIDMGVYMKDKVPNASGQKVVGSEKELSIKLQDCPHYDGYDIMPKIVFRANHDDHNSKLIKLDGTGAEGIGIGLYDSSGRLLDIKDVYESKVATSKDNRMLTFLFKAAYVSNGQKVKSGKANASINFEVSYK
ncbi:fimbrial protein [Arsenophonus nasoniae]|nr:fimbrial protein [Arsenophonus nasoniae]QBY45104.1 putative major fimbrial subunit LpfA [Arsenophonus nasoniae]WGM02213.1 fimbrial protein [Arsenophonus nasoniae]WGM05309.1 fimbrial protein [Arsenophonus nasoniae]WGM10317.1 fimbrial protein [Arsenophonus nasoniae]WGM15032.1 fimbrial protein [Arsenophonus nasoniae]